MIFFLVQGQTQTEADVVTQNELLKRYQEVLEEKTTLTFELQDVHALISRLQAQLLSVSQSRDNEQDRAQVLFGIIEELEEECSRIAASAEAKQEAVTELQEALHAMEQKEESRSKDVDEMALHLAELRERLNDIQDEADKNESGATEGEMREMYQVGCLLTVLIFVSNV